MKRTNLIIIGLIIIVGGAIAAAATGVFKTPSQSNVVKPSGSASKTSTATSPDNVVITNYTFMPTPIKVKVGTKVTWTNNDIAKHTITVDTGQPAGGPESAFFGKGQTYSFTFATAGTYRYHCEPHPYMHGVVEVTQ